MSPEHFIELGRDRERLRSLEVRVSRLEEIILVARGWLQRGLMAASLWGIGSILHLNAEQLGGLLAALIQGLLIR